jgi:hydroxypyruvate reductase
MAKAATDLLGDRVARGVVITKYDHAQGPIKGLDIFEAGHPIPDENSFRATQAAIELVKPLGAGETVLFLVSGGGSALFEQPLCSPEELQDVTRQLLACGADITEINAIRKRLSAVKGGRFAELCAPARVVSVILSDVLGDRLDAIASGPAVPDACSVDMARRIAAKYRLRLSDRAQALLGRETPKALDNVENHVIGSVRQLCEAAACACKSLGYETCILTDRLNCEAKQAGTMLAKILRENENSDKSLAFIAGGETVVKLTGHGKGGRNQELALSAASDIQGITGAAVFSVGSDGTDGPTDAAGGYVDYTTAQALKEKDIDLFHVLAENDAYHGLQAVDGLIITGPTGTNVNDVAVALLQR